MENHTFSFKIIFHDIHSRENKLSKVWQLNQDHWNHVTFNIFASLLLILNTAIDQSSAYWTFREWRINLFIRLLGILCCTREWINELGWNLWQCLVPGIFLLLTARAILIGGSLQLPMWSLFGRCRGLCVWTLARDAPQSNLFQFHVVFGETG